MRKRGKRLLSLLLAMLMIASCLPIMAIGVSAAAPTDGMTFKVDDVYKMPKIDKGIASFKAEIWIDPTMSDTYRYGIMLGNYTDAGSWYYEINWEIVAGGKPKYFNEKCGNVTFDTDLRDYITGSDYIEVAIVIDNANAKALLYVDGELVETKTKTDSGKAINMSVMIPAKHRDNDTITDYSLIVGGDYRSGNKQYFKGNIKSMSVYTDTAMAEANAVASYDLTSFASDPDAATKDKTANGNHLIFDSNRGLTFALDDEPTTVNIDQIPNTFAAWIYMPESVSSRGGVIIGNYSNTVKTCRVNMEIYTNGNPRLYYRGTDGDHSAIFTEVDVRTNTWAHVVIVHEGTQLKCYLNGVLKQTLTEDTKNNAATPVAPISQAPVPDMVLGMDQRPEASNRKNSTFKGIIRDVALYNDAKTAAEIATICSKGVDVEDDGIIAYYDLEDLENSNYVPDLTGNGYSMGKMWLDESVLDLDGYDHTFVVVGDTQKQAWKDWNTATDTTVGNETSYMADIYKWIVDNKDTHNIKYVFGVGDITEKNGLEKNGSSELEWEIAKNAIIQLDAANMDYSLVMGNHDTVAQLNKYFAPAGDDFYTSRVTGYYQEGSLGNYYINFEVEGVEYMVLCLEYGANDKILKWAGEVVDAHPERRVIMTTHAYMFRDGTTLDKGDVVPPNASGITVDENSRNNGDMMWEKFVSQHRNIILVLSGHDPYENIAFRQDTGIEGNTVSQFLVDPQGMDVTLGMVALLHVSADGRKVAVEWYSTTRGQYYQVRNQFEFTMIDNEGNGVHSMELIEDKSDATKSVYRIYYTNGTYSEFTIYNGKDGSVGPDGADGTDAIAPQFKIDSEGYWNVSYDNGASWNSLGVKAKGDKGETGDAGSAGLAFTVTSVEKTDTSDLTDTYTVTFSDNTEATFTVTNGADGNDAVAGSALTVLSVEMTATDGITDTYTIIFSDNSIAEFEITSGVDGEIGKTPYVGENGNWFIGGVDTEVYASGVQGATPYIGANGNWWVNGTDTGVYPQGEKGDPGKQGATGATGATGAAGAAGEKGDKGDKGDKGAVGAAGATGPQGASGVTAVVIGLGTASAIMGVCSIGMGAVCIFIGKKKKLL